MKPSCHFLTVLVSLATLAFQEVRAATVTWNMPGSGTWNIIDANWTGGLPEDGKYVNGDTVSFTNTAGGDIALSGAIAPAATLVSASSGTYAFTGTGITSGTLTKTGAGNLILKNLNSHGGTTTVNGGRLTVSDQGASTGSGALNIGAANPATGVFQYDSGASSSYSTIQIGANTNGNGTLNQTGGQITATLLRMSTVYSGNTGTINLSGGTFRITDDASVGERASGAGGGVSNVNVSASGVLQVDGTLTLGGGGSADGRHGTGTLTQTGGSVMIGDGLVFTRAADLSFTRRGTYHLNGGILTVDRISQAAAGVGTQTGTFNFNGGTLKASESSATFMQGLTRANIRNGGAIIDTGVYDIAIGQALNNSDIGGGNATDGGLVKNGSATLTLSGSSTFTGNATVNEGTLAVTGSLAATTTEVKNGATLSGTGPLGGNLIVRSGGRLDIDLGTTPTSQIFRTVGGTVVFEEGTTVNLKSASLPLAGGPFTLLTANGGITGAPTTVMLDGTPGLVAVAAVGNKLELTAATLRPLERYNFMAGTQTFGSSYQFTSESKLVETARAMLAMGSNMLKFSLEGDSSYSTLANRAASDASVKTVFALPFAHYFMWVSPLGAPYGSGHPFDPVRLPSQRAEIYELTRYLLRTFNGTGKTFYLGNWEGDWLLTNVQSTYQPSEVEIQNAVAWAQVRQQAVDDARRDTPHSDVEVYHYVEVNQVPEAMNGMNRLTNRVLPLANPDYVSYSAYGAQTNNIEATLVQHLNYIESNLPAKTGLPATKRVFVGEYGLNVASSQSGGAPAQQLLTRRVLRAALAWGCPAALYWQMFDNPDAGFWLIDNQNVKQPAYFAHEFYLTQSRAYIASFQATHLRLPTREEFSAQAVAWLAGPPDFDAESDGLTAGVEAGLTFPTDPLHPDTDRDKFTDAEEVAHDPSGASANNPNAFPNAARPVTYVDAQHTNPAANGYTTLATGGVFTPAPELPAPGADNKWRLRQNVGTGGSIYESNGEAREDAPRLATIIKGLEPGAQYDVYGYFWSIGTDNWRLRASHQNPGTGNLPSFIGNDTFGSGSIHAPAVNRLYSGSGAYNLAPLDGHADANGLADNGFFASGNGIVRIAEGGRDLYQASLGQATADSNGRIAVFIDDFANEISSYRTWYDGVGYARISPVLSGYDAWLAQYPGLTDPSPGGDPDRDGIPNLLEYVLDGNLTRSDSSILPTVAATPTSFVMTFHRRDDSEAATTQTFQYCSGLTGWIDVPLPAVSGVVGAATVTITENVASPDLVTVSVPRGSNGSLFGRLRVTKP